ncbi:glycoside hydrolase family 15 protein [Streptomyces sp. NPDC001820]|uniref:glycoside hydrolase family 15 protein n=1 Tax=Streptomyces sp. NPDC001820 TaxID=3364613 RepID=UPI0036B62D68
MPQYPPIADHGMIGDLQTVALVASDGAVDWFCAPRFDSPSIFAALLDQERGGSFRIAADAPDVRVTQLYLPDTAVLVTRFLTAAGVGEVVDLMPLHSPETATDRHRMFRVMRVVRGSMSFTVDCSPRFDYGRATHTLKMAETGDGAVFTGPGIDLHLQSSAPLWTDNGTDVQGAVTLRAGETAAIVMTTCANGAEPPEPLTRAAAESAWASTVDFWHRWLRTSRYRGRWRQTVNRSAITLKLLTYAPTGAPVAAATAGLPEQIGGERNWDYRYTWIRDASLSLGALIDLGFTHEANAFRRWLGERLAAGATDSGHPLQIMYRVDGDPKLGEEVLDHLEGYRKSFPVRIGNGAADQLQLDIYGEAAFALTHSGGIAESGGFEGWQAIARVLDWLADNWDQPDEGIWETRGGRKNFTYSRLMSWVAFARGIRLAREYARPADLERWTATRDAIFLQVMERGWSEKHRAFVQHYDSDVLDSSLLLMPTVGFVAPKDPRWLATLDAMDRELVSDSLVYRYDPSASPDGLRGSEGTFTLCTFHYVQALARADRVGEARYAFEKMLTYANHVGLFAEEIGPTGEQLGNFPQAFTHLSLITAAMALDDALDKTEAREP